MHGELDKLEEALTKNEEKAEERLSWSAENRAGGRGDLMGVVDGVLGYEGDEGLRREERQREMMD